MSQQDASAIAKTEQESYELLKIRYFFTPLGFEVYVGEYLKRAPYFFQTFCVEHLEQKDATGIDIKGMREKEDGQKEYLIVQCQNWDSYAISLEELAAWYEKVEIQKNKYPKVYLVYITTTEAIDEVKDFALKNNVHLFFGGDILKIMKEYSFLEFFEEISDNELYNAELLFTPYFFEQTAMQLQFDYRKESVKQDAIERRSTLNQLLKIFMP